MGETVAQIRARLAKERDAEAAPLEKALAGKKKKRPGRWLSTGSGLLNLACTDNVDRGFLSGNYYYFVGDSSSGKTFICMTCFAEAANNHAFDKYTFVFINAENGAHMDYEKFFGAKMAKRLKIIEAKDCRTVQDFYYKIFDLLSEGPCLIILDSMDALSDKDEQKKFKQKKDDQEQGKDGKGSYGVSKAKTNSTDLRVVFNKVVETGSILIMISQTRDRIGFGAQFNPKTRSGGNALTFYAGCELWTSQGGHLTTTYKGKKREQGIVSAIRLKKNRLSGKDRSVRVPIYHSAGIDDVGSCIDYLVDEKHWATTKKEKEDGYQKIAEGKITAPEFDFTGSREKLREHIIQNGLRSQLYAIVQSVWDDIEANCAVLQEQRYA